MTTEGPPDVYKDTGLSLSIMANVVKGSFTSDQAVSGRTLTPQYLIIYFDPNAFFSPQENTHINVTHVQEHKIKDINWTI